MYNSDVIRFESILQKKGLCGAVNEHERACILDVDHTTPHGWVLEEKQVSNESVCNKCGGPNPIWACESPLWNYVMRNNNDSPEPFNGIICPVCFTQLAEEAGAGRHIDPIDGRTIIWRLTADPAFITAPLKMMTNDDRVWDADKFCWVQGVSYKI